ncbi:hypothetical protein AGMMS49521_4590 [Campylobacterota bacterium]|nr:hypothetical protein AGMMS49521_4590 [Campylobacterota bacterium]
MKIKDTLKSRWGKKMKIKDTLTSALKKVARAEMKKVVTAMIVFGIVVSPAFEAMAMLGRNEDEVVKEPIQGGSSTSSSAGTEAGSTGGVAADVGEGFFF